MEFGDAAYEAENSYASSFSSKTKRFAENESPEMKNMYNKSMSQKTLHPAQKILDESRLETEELMPVSKRSLPKFSVKDNYFSIYDGKGIPSLVIEPVLEEDHLQTFSCTARFSDMTITTYTILTVASKFSRFLDL